MAGLAWESVDAVHVERTRLFLVAVVGGEEMTPAVRHRHVPHKPIKVISDEGAEHRVRVFAELFGDRRQDPLQSVRRVRDVPHEEGRKR